MRNPLKQGLKPLTPTGSTNNVLIAMRNPLKQGLKHFTTVNTETCLTDRNAKSTKTRIETYTIY